MKTDIINLNNNTYIRCLRPGGHSHDSCSIDFEKEDGKTIIKENIRSNDVNWLISDPEFDLCKLDPKIYHQGFRDIKDGYGPC